MAVSSKLAEVSTCFPLKLKCFRVHNMFVYQIREFLIKGLEVAQIPGVNKIKQTK